MANLQAATANQLEPPVRPEIEKGVLDASNVGEVERPLSAWERLTNITALRRIFILVMIAVFWEAYARFLDKPLMLPTFVDTATTFWDELMRSEEHTSELQSLMRISYAVFCLKKKITKIVKRQIT